MPKHEPGVTPDRPKVAGYVTLDAATLAAIRAVRAARVGGGTVAGWVREQIRKGLAP